MSEPKKLSEQDIYYETVIKTQQKQLIESNKRANEYKLEIENLKTEIRHLRALPASDITSMNQKGSRMNNEEIICLQEIAKLKDISDERALEFDEVKKLEILNKVLKSHKLEDDKKDDVGNISTEELLQAINQAAK